MSIVDSHIISYWPNVETPLGSLLNGGELITDIGWGLQAYRQLDHYSLGFLLEGAGRYRDNNGVNVRLKEGDCIWTPPGLLHQYGCEPGDTWKEVYLCFKGDPFDVWNKSGKLGEHPILSLRDVKLWGPRWKEILSSKPRNFAGAMRNLSRIHLLLNDLTSTGMMTHRFEDRLEASRQHLSSWPPHAPPDWKLLSTECGCSYETWRKAFKKTYEVSPAKYRRAVLMNQAALLMTRSSISNDELAERFGCSDGFHFSKLFKSVHGVSPRAYQQSLRHDNASAE